jgi:magnesium-protoporphyrin IX monomethyl ester (oxidative) cyclase
MKPSLDKRPIRKVMLIFPPVTIARIYDKMCCLPMGIAYLGAVLRDRYEVKLLDAVVEGHHLERDLAPRVFQYGLDADMIMERVREFAPDVVGMSCLFSNQFPVVAELARRVKAWNPEVVTVTGGTHPTFLPERCLREEALDYIVMGEAEESLPALLRALETGSGREAIDGLAFRDGDRQVIHPKTAWIKDLDSLPFPARDLLPLEKYFDINIPFLFFSRSRRNLSFITSRGCPCRCNFCSSTRYWGGRLRARSPANVLAELEHLKSRYGIEEVKFEDDNLTFDGKRAQAIFQGMIDRRLNLSWNMPNGVMVKTLGDRELVRLMKRSGCFEVILAFESGDQWVLDNIVNKPLDLEAARAIVKGVQEEGIDTHAFFIVGFPGETLAQIKNTFAYARSLDLDKIYVFIFNPLPGTPLYQQCLDRGLIRDEYQTEENCYLISGFSDQEWTPELLEKMQRREYWRSTFSLLRRRPRKFFGKYVRRVLRRDQLKTLYHIAADLLRRPAR